MKDIEFTLTGIKDLMDAFSRNKLGKMKIEQGEFKLELEAGGVVQTVCAPAVLAAVDAQPAPEIPDQPSGNIVKSPIVGTFYASPAPDKAPFVEVGHRVQKGDILFIIESMKLMNEVSSEFNGTVKEIFVKNGMAVEYGQPIISIE